MKNGVEEIENVCKLYGRGKYAIGSRSITIDDINKITGYNPNNIGKYDRYKSSFEKEKIIYNFQMVIK